MMQNVLVPVSNNLSRETQRLVIRFAAAMAEKLEAAERKGRGGWEHSDWRNECIEQLHVHLAKGDPVDVANFCAFMWHHKWPTGTQAAQWRADGETDPHGNRYNCERASLAMGHLTDDELANGAYLNYDRFPPPSEILAGNAHSPIAWMTAVKDRIRWLSRMLTGATTREAQQNAALVALAGNLLASLRLAEDFMAGFEDDEMQEGINERLANIRNTIKEAEALL